MKHAKPQHRIPWWCFDVPHEKPSTQGWWKSFQKRLERNFWKREIRRMTNEEYKNY